MIRAHRQRVLVLVVLAQTRCCMDAVQFHPPLCVGVKYGYLANVWELIAQRAALSSGSGQACMPERIQQNILSMIVQDKQYGEV